MDMVVSYIIRLVLLNQKKTVTPKKSQAFNNKDKLQGIFRVNQKKIQGIFRVNSMF